MKLSNNEIAELFTRLADLLEIDGANPFRVRAYRNASRTIKSLARNLSDLVDEAFNLRDLQGIGKEIATKIQEIVSTGRLAKLAELEKRFPDGIHQVLKLSLLAIL